VAQGHPLALVVLEPQVVLRQGVPLLRGAPVPLARLGVRLLHASALLVHDAEAVLRVGVPLVSAETVPLARLLVGRLGNPAPELAHHPEVVLGAVVPLLRGLGVPVHGLLVRLRHPAPLLVLEPEVVLRRGVPLLRGLAVVVHRALVGLLDAAALLVHDAEAVFRVGVVEFGGLLEPAHGHRVRLGHPAPLLVEDSHVVLRRGVALLRGEQKPAHGLLVVLRDASVALAVLEAHRELRARVPALSRLTVHRDGYLFELDVVLGLLGLLGAEHMVRPRQPAVRLRLGLRAEDFGQPGLAHRLTGLVPRDRLGPRLGPCLEGVEPAGLVEEAAELGLGLLPWAPATGLPRRQRVEHRLSQVLVGRQLRGRGQGRGLGRRAAQVARGATNGGAARARLVLPDDVLLRVELALHALAALELPRHPPDVHLVDHLEVELHPVVALLPVPHVVPEPHEAEREADAGLGQGIVPGDPVAEAVPVPRPQVAQVVRGRVGVVDAAHGADLGEGEVEDAEQQDHVVVHQDVRVQHRGVRHLREVVSAAVLERDDAQQDGEDDAHARPEVVGAGHEGGERGRGEQEDHQDVVPHKVAGLAADDRGGVQALEAAEGGRLLGDLPVQVAGHVEVDQLGHARRDEEALVVGDGDDDPVHGIPLALVQPHDDLQVVHIEGKLVEFERIPVGASDLIRDKGDAFGLLAEVKLAHFVEPGEELPYTLVDLLRLLVGRLQLLLLLLLHLAHLVHFVVVETDPPHAGPVRPLVYDRHDALPRGRGFLTHHHLLQVLLRRVHDRFVILA